jgi:hypothetical protein
MRRGGRVRNGAQVGSVRRMDEDDAYYMLDGELTFLFADQRLTAPPGTDASGCPTDAP